MSDEQQQPQDPSKEPQTPGEILKAAREFRGYHQNQVAERLRLSVQTIKDIENDDYTHFTAEIYLRGHIRSYARVCDVDPEIVLKAFEGMGIEIESDPQVPVMMAHDVPVSRRSRRTKRKTLLWAGLGVLLVLIVMVVLWWQEQQRHMYYSQKATVPIETKATTEVKPAADERMAAPLQPPTRVKKDKLVRHKAHHRKITHHASRETNNDTYAPDYSVTPVE